MFVLSDFVRYYAECVNIIGSKREREREIEGVVVY